MEQAVREWLKIENGVRVKFSFLQVVEKMERETGIEPATNSLEG